MKETKAKEEADARAAAEALERKRIEEQKRLEQKRLEQERRSAQARAPPPEASLHREPLVPRWLTLFMRLVRYA